MKRCYDFGPDQVKAINRLSSELGIGKTDVIASGLMLLRLAVLEARRGRRIGVVSGASVVTEFIGPWSEVEPSPAA